MVTTMTTKKAAKKPLGREEGPTPQSASLNAGKKRVFILEDHPIVRQGIADLITQEMDMTVCGQSDNYKEALENIASLKPDVVLLDISLNGASGLELLCSLKTHQPDAKVLILSMHDETLYAERALREGAKGYIMKQEATEKVLEAIRHVVKGQIYLSDQMLERVLEKKYAGCPTDASPMETLSDRELEVFRLIGEGISTSIIAKQLHRSIKTIETYRARIKVKLNLKNNMELIRAAMHWIQDPK
jgi:DNA-binding NarL/FixJ family response regulator